MEIRLIKRSRSKKKKLVKRSRSLRKMKVKRSKSLRKRLVKRSRSIRKRLVKRSRSMRRRLVKKSRHRKDGSQVDVIPQLSNVFNSPYTKARPDEVPQLPSPDQYNQFIEDINILKTKVKSLEEFRISREDRISEKFMNKFKYSIVRITSFSEEMDPYQPHIKTSLSRGRGSGFIIDIKNGLILTNEHVIHNSREVEALIGTNSKPIKLEIVSLCAERDIAVCKIPDEEIKKILEIKSAEEINMTFADSFNFKSLKEVYVIGYPLGLDNIKTTAGEISGFYSNNEEEESPIQIFDSEDSPSYLQTSAPVNKGNSGGPLIDNNGNVLGIVSAGLSFIGFFSVAQNINYVIGTRTIFSIIENLIDIGRRDNIITPARYSFTFNKASPLQLKDCSPETEGLRVNKISKDSCFLEQLREGDIILSISVENYKDYTIPIEKKFVENVYKVKGNFFINEDKDNTRRFSLKEIFDSVPNGRNVTLKICRKGVGLSKMTEVFTRKTPPDVYRNKLLITTIEPFKFVVCFGLAIYELALNHVMNAPFLNKYIEGDNRFKSFLLITYVYPYTNAFTENEVKSMSVIETIDGKSLNTIDSLKKHLEENIGSISITIETKEREQYIISKKIEDIESVKTIIGNPSIKVY